MSSSNAMFEVCLNCDEHSLLAANVSKTYQAGVQRIELCRAMELEGLTPDIEAVTLARRHFKSRPGLMVMIRPRAGDFCYNPAEAELMLRQISQVAEAGADGVVLGALTPDNTGLDLPLLTRLVKLSQSLALKVCFHRAFDALSNRYLALQQLIALGVDRVLTSGSPWGEAAPQTPPLAVLTDITAAANGQIEVVFAGGITPQRAGKIAKQVAFLNGQISFHAYSGVLARSRYPADAASANNRDKGQLKGEVDMDKIKALLAMG